MDKLIVDNKKYKKYLFEYIIDNKWLTSVSFWEGIIDISIKKELEAKQESNKEAISKENETERKERISNICFSHMLPLTNNMIEFFMKKDVIKKTVDLFVKKYDIDEKNAQMIYDNIENTPKPPLPLSKRKKKSRQAPWRTATCPRHPSSARFRNGRRDKATPSKPPSPASDWPCLRQSKTRPWDASTAPSSPKAPKGITPGMQPRRRTAAGKSRRTPSSALPVTQDATTILRIGSLEVPETSRHPAF